MPTITRAATADALPSPAAPRPVDDSPAPRHLAARAGRWSADHPWRAIALWVVFVLVAIVGGSFVGTKQIADRDAGTGSSGRAEQAIADHFPSAPAGESVLLTTRGSVRDPAFRAAVTDVVTRIRATGQAQRVRSPLDTDGAGLLARDGHAALVQFDMKGDPDKAENHVQPLLNAVAAANRAHPGVTIAETGDASISKALDDSVGKDFKRAEKLSIPLTFAVLLFVFGALVSAILPVALSMTAVIASIGLLGFASHLAPVDDTANSVLLLIGLAVGVDYSLFYVSRERQERAAGKTAREALLIASATSGRAVLVSGLTVLLAMSGMLLVGDATFTGVGEATMLVVAAAIAGSLTVLPALLSLLGDKVDRGRIPFLGRLRGRSGESRVWGAILRPVLARPAISLALSVAAMLALAVPALGMHVAQPGASDLPATLPAVQTFEHLQTVFPGGGSPAEVTVVATDVRTPAVQLTVTQLIDRALATGQAHQPVDTRVSTDGKVEVVSLPLSGNGEDQASTQALRVLRGEVLPAVLRDAPDVTMNVTGMTAGNVDFSDHVRARAPLVVVFVLVLAFVLLLFSLRSWAVAASAVVLNLLSVGAAYGLLTLVFQHRVGAGLLGFSGTHPISAWLPLFLFTVLFGLSMDYHVFLLSRMREARLAGASSRDAVSIGVRSSAGVVTAAAVVMVFVFGVFATLSQVSMQELGVGLAAAVLVDATIVRGVLLPSVMAVLGDRAWREPRFLARRGLDRRGPARRGSEHAA